ncbi:MAG: CDP-diacylglycerol--glycerol-3-phosphate 3-phosphatidyltransferase [Actinobacteria bacterium]|nr:CDP-diacylglycerol--glycerol-3-phosphate 3-phosphatidyltransferase [Actinomycetota bacterium]
MNPANVVTWIRIALIPVFVYFMYEAGDSTRMTAAGWTALAIYVVATFSDYLDGYLARRLDVITPTGQFLDPLADKFLVGAALVGLIAFKDFPVWAALVMAVREVAIVTLRSAAMRRGNSMPAGKHAKYKTTVQLVMVLLWLFPRAGAWMVVQDVLLYAAVLITAYSGLRYGLLSRRLLTRQPGPAERQ